MKSGADLWYVRDGGEVTGPFTTAELAVRRRRGEIQWYHELSHDQLIWVSASAHPEFLEAGAGPAPGPTPGTRGGRGAALAFGAAALATAVGLAVLTLRPGGPGNDDAAAILRVLREDEAVSRETVHAVGAHDSPSNYALAIARYVSRMRAVDTSDCPPEFRVAYKHHLDAWVELQEEVAKLPDDFLEGLFVGMINGLLRREIDGGLTRMGDAIESATKGVNATFREVETIAARHGAALP